MKTLPSTDSVGSWVPDGFWMTAVVTMVIMSAGGLVTAGPLCGPHSAHSHLHFHWQLFSPHKKFNTPICAFCSARDKCGKGLESSCFKSQLIVPGRWEGPEGRIAGLWGLTSVHSSSSVLMQTDHKSKERSDSFCSELWSSEEILCCI